MLIFSDIYNFKSIRDTFSHEAGDKVLCHTEEPLLGNVPATGPNALLLVADQTMYEEKKPWYESAVGVSTTLGVGSTH